MRTLGYITTITMAAAAAALGLVASNHCRMCGGT
jgi:hypothetical protein